jgi:hypothetical protein
MGALENAAETVAIAFSIIRRRIRRISNYLVVRRWLNIESSPSLDITSVASD